MIQRIKNRFKRLLVGVAHPKVAFIDFDFTLAKTTECVQVLKDDGSYYRLDSNEYNNVKDKIQDRLTGDSFIEFNNVDLDKAQPIWNTIRFVEELYRQGWFIIILSARTQLAEDDIRKFMSKYSCLNNDFEFIGLKSGNPEDKYKVIKQIKQKQTIFIDDNFRTLSYSAMRFGKELIYGYVYHNEESVLELHNHETNKWIKNI